MLKKSAELHKKKNKKKRNQSRSRNRNKLSNEFLTFEVFKAFKRLRKAFLEAFILQHFDSTKFIRVEIDVSNKAISEILDQPNDKSH